jgi:ATP synthase protein I
MNDEPDNGRDPYEDLRRQVGRRETRKIRARQRQNKRLWFGLGMYGLIGWAVAAPTMLGLALGIWIDSRWPSGYSWTLMLMIMGLILGCWNAWYWLQKEGQLIDQGRKEKEEE